MSGSILSSVTLQTFAVYIVINGMVGLCPNLWCNNSRATFFLGAILFYFDICFIIPKYECSRCALCGKVIAFSPCRQITPYQKPLLNKQVCTKFINIIIENNLSHRSGAKSTL